MNSQHNGSMWTVSYSDMLVLLLGFIILFLSLKPSQPGLLQGEEHGFVTHEDSKGAGSDLVSGILVERIAIARRNLQRLYVRGVQLFLGKEAAIQVAKEIRQGNQGIYQKKETGHGSLGGGSEERSVLQPVLLPEGLVTEALRATEAVVNQQGNRLAIQFPKISFFGSAETDLTESGRHVLRQFAEGYRPFASKVVVHILSYADSRPVTPGKYRFRDNWELSALRAVSVQRFLQEQGIPTKQTRLGVGAGMEAFGFSANAGPYHYAVSRRVALIIEPHEVRQSLETALK